MPNQTSRAGWAKLGTGLAIAAAEAAADYLHPAFAEALAIADVTIPVIIGLILLIIIVRGSNQTYERVFRLLRWISNRPEPAGPDSCGPSPRTSSAGSPGDSHAKGLTASAESS